MDTGEGRFEKFQTEDEYRRLVNQYPKAKGIFTIGEELEIKGSNFRVIQITPFGIRLKLLSQSPQIWSVPRTHANLMTSFERMMSQSLKSGQVLERGKV